MLLDKTIVAFNRKRWWSEKIVELFEELQLAIIDYQVRIVENCPSSEIYVYWTAVTTI